MLTEINTDVLVEMLRERGYYATVNTVTKNGVQLEGVSILNDDGMGPCLYLEDLKPHYSDYEDLIDGIIRIYENNKTIDFEIEWLCNREWILNHVYIALQRASGEALVKRDTDFQGIEQYLYLRYRITSQLCSIKLSFSMLENAGLTAEEAWAAANANTLTAEETVISNMGSIFSQYCSFKSEPELYLPMYVISNPSQIKGSAQILDRRSIRNFFPPSVNRLICIPSSIHECILIPDGDENYDLNEINAIISEVNSEVVDRTEQLGDTCYLMAI